MKDPNELEKAISDFKFFKLFLEMRSYKLTGAMQSIPVTGTTAKRRIDRFRRVFVKWIHMDGNAPTYFQNKMDSSMFRSLLLTGKRDRLAVEDEVRKVIKLGLVSR